MLTLKPPRSMKGWSVSAHDQREAAFEHGAPSARAGYRGGDDRELDPASDDDASRDVFRMGGSGVTHFQLRRDGGGIAFEGEFTSLRQCVETAVLCREGLGSIDLNGAALAGANLLGAYFWGAQFARADLSAATLARAILSDADLHGACLRGAFLADTRLARAKLAGASLRGAVLNGAVLIDADLSRADLRGARLAGADLTGARLCGADLHGAELAGAKLHGAHLEGARWRPGVRLAGPPIAVHGLARPVWIVGNHVQIGARLQPIAEWHEANNDSDQEDPDAALWRQHGSALAALAGSSD